MSKILLIIEDVENGEVVVNIKFDGQEFPPSIGDLKRNMTPAVHMAVIGYQAIQMAGKNPIQNAEESRK